MNGGGGGVGQHQQQQRNPPMPVQIHNLNSLEQIERHIRTSPPNRTFLSHALCNCKCHSPITFLSSFSFYSRSRRLLEMQHTTSHLQSHSQSQAASDNANASPLAQFFSANNLVASKAPASSAPKPMRSNKPNIQAPPPGFRSNHRMDNNPGDALIPQLSSLMAFETSTANNNTKPKEAMLKNKLVTPAMLSSSVKKDSNITQHNNTQQKMPLEKFQLLDALQYLIANDDEFKKKVYDAYICSFTKANV